MITDDGVTENASSYGKLTKEEVENNREAQAVRKRLAWLFQLNPDFLYLMEHPHEWRDLSMFDAVVYRYVEDGTWSVEGITTTGEIRPPTTYKDIDDLPPKIQRAVKQLLWVSPDDSTGVKDVGVRIGQNTFWIATESDNGNQT